MISQSNEQSLKVTVSKKRYGWLLLEYILKVCLPAVVIVVWANLVLSSHPLDDTPQAIQKAFWARNYERARDLCKTQINADIFDLTYHRAYLNCCLKINSRRNRNDKQINRHQQTEQEYEQYTLHNDPAIADIGHYGLGYYYSLRQMYPLALAALDKVRHKNLKHLNNSIGYAYLETGDTQKAKQYFQIEIVNNGDLQSACSNLARLYYQQKDFASLNNLVSNERLRPYIPGSICRHMDLHNRRFGLYFANVFTFDYLTLPGLIAAVVVLWIWFNYLRKLDVFEPEKLSWLLRALILGMAFTLLCGLLYDISDFGFGLSLTGRMIDDLMYCIFGIGLIEESVKIIPFLILLKFSGQINESIDYIIYAAVCALGFAFMENLLYFQEPGLTAIIGRTVWSVTAHMTWSALAAYGLFYAKYKKHNKSAVVYFVFTFAAACVLHGLYDFFLMAKGLWPGMEMASLLILLLSILIFSNMIKNALNQSEFYSDKLKEVEGLSKHLVYSLSAVVLLQYLLVGWKLGIDNANFQFHRQMIFSYIPLINIFACLGVVNLQKGLWIPLFENQKKGNAQAAEHPYSQTSPERQ